MARGGARAGAPIETIGGAVRSAPGSLVWMLFASVMLLYVSLTPGVIAHMGYTGEEMRTGNLLLDRMRGEPVTEMRWSRHGVLTVLLDVPLLGVGRVLGRHASISQEHVLSLAPVLWSAGLITLLFVWLFRITQDAIWSYGLSLIAAFCTLLWPYAYIGLEPKQSLCIVAAGYLGLEAAGRARVTRSLLLGLACGGAIGLKAGGTYLIPAVAFLIGVYILRQRAASKPGWLTHALMVTVVTVGIYSGNAITRSWYWARLGGMGAFVASWLVESPLAFALNVFSIFASPAKGLIVYAPVCLLGLLLMRGAWQRDRVLVSYCGLVVAGTAVGFGLLRSWSDETWGARYLHVAVAPLVLCLGLVVPALARAHKVALAITAVAGLGISFLGAFCYYGTLHGVATATDQATLEAVQSDPVWNHVAFNARLFRIWWSPASAPATWTPQHRWWFTRPANAPPWKSFDLRLVAQPQSVLLRGWGHPTAGWALTAWRGLLLCLVVGSALLVYTGVRALRYRAAAPVQAGREGPATGRTSGMGSGG